MAGIFSATIMRPIATQHLVKKLVHQPMNRIAGKFKRGEITENQALELIKHWAQYRLLIEDDVREADTERELEDEEYEDLSHHSWTGVHDEESVEQ